MKKTINRIRFGPLFALIILVSCSTVPNQSTVEKKVVTQPQAEYQQDELFIEQSSEQSGTEKLSKQYWQNKTWRAIDSVDAINDSI